MVKLFKRNQGLVGIDFGAQCVKLAQLVRRSGQLVLERAAIFERASAATSFEVSDVGEWLRGCDQFSGRTSAATLSMLACEYKSEPIPAPAAEAELHRCGEQLAARESRLPRPLQHACWLTDNGGRDGPILHALATSRPTTHAIAQQHRASGWTCTTLDGLPTALARAVRLGDILDNGPVAAIDWGWSRVTLCVVLRGEPMFVRSFERGSLHALMEPICDELNLTLREARHLLTSVGLPGDRNPANTRHVQAEIARHTAAALADFQDEVARTLSFLQARQPDICPRRAVLFGGGATVGNIAAHVSAATGLETTTWSFVSKSEAHLATSRVPTVLLGPAIALSALAWGSE